MPVYCLQQLFSDSRSKQYINFNFKDLNFGRSLKTLIFIELFASVIIMTRDPQQGSKTLSVGFISSS